MSKIRVLVVDDHAIVRDGICAILTIASDMEVVGVAADGSEALKMVRELQPEVVLLDIAMPVMDGLEATRRIHQEFPRISVLVLTQYDDEEFVFPAIEAGALGFISKVSASTELTTGIRAVYHGDSYLSPPVARLLVQNYQKSPTRTHLNPYEQLTQRERDVLKLLVEGHTTREIAKILVITAKTVEGHKTNLMAKLGVHNRFELYKYALRKGIIRTHKSDTRLSRTK